MSAIHEPASQHKLPGFPATLTIMGKDRIISRDEIYNISRDALYSQKVGLFPDVDMEDWFIKIGFKDLKHIRQFCVKTSTGSVGPPRDG